MQTLLNSPLCYATRRKFPPPRPWNIIAGSVVRARVVLLRENPTTVGESRLVKAKQQQTIARARLCFPRTRSIGRRPPRTPCDSLGVRYVIKYRTALRQGQTLFGKRTIGRLESDSDCTYALVRLSSTALMQGNATRTTTFSF
jgi:hypothetical protein